MTTIGSFDAKTHLPALLERAGKGEKILITKHGRPVAMLTSPQAGPTTDVAEIIAAFKAYSRERKRSLRGLRIREMIQEGRRF